MRLTHTHVDYIRKLLASGAVNRAAVALGKLHPADIAEIFASLATTETATLLSVLFGQKKAGEVLAELPEGILQDVLEQLEDERIVRILENLDPNDALQFLSTIPVERHEKILDKLAASTRNSLEQLLIYPEDSSGHWMTNSFMSVSTTTTAREAVEEIRQQSERVEAPLYVYVLEEDGKLAGVIPLRRMVTCPPNTPVRELMLTDPFTVHVHTDREEAASIAKRYNLLAVPVVDDSHKLVGVIPGDSLFDVMEKEATEDMYRLAGLSEADRVFTPVSTAFMKRFPWLWINLGTAFLASTVVRLFESTIAQFATLAAFMPVVAGMGGNAGNQSLIVITRGIALGELEFSSGLKAILKEAAVGLFLGLVGGTAAAVIAVLTTGGERSLLLGMVVFCAMVLNLALAGIVGATIPLLLRAIGRDPALGSNIIVTAFTDSFGYLLLLGLGLAIIF
ncbi:magnesium transporter [Candidatus Fermentibacteria bacterium]|nr:magnesium transporter [Candidatus Fermentibacteria bacterium]